MVMALIVYYLIGILFVIYSFRKFFITPSMIFVGMQMVMLSGILAYTDFSNSSDRKLVFVYLVALVMFILGTFTSASLFGRNLSRVENIKIDKNDNHLLNSNQAFLIVAMQVVSILICVYFFAKAGYNVFVQIIQSAISGGSNDYTNDRLQLNNISGVGYVYQFRVIILPLLTAFLLSYNKKSMLHKLGVISFPLMIIFVLGTGQRGGFVMFILMWFVALLYMYKIYKDPKIKRSLIVIVTFSVALFGLMTVFNGRVDEGENVILAMLQRIFNDNQECAVVAFRYIDSKPIQYGRDWFLSVKDILPGKNTYVQLSYVIFGVMYGSIRGTAPPCIWGSTYYNWGWIGIILFPFIMGMLYQKLYCRFLKGKMSHLRIFIFSAMFVVLGNWIADTPLVLFNQGFITLCIMKFLLIPNIHFTVNGKRLL